MYTDIYNTVKLLLKEVLFKWTAVVILMMEWPIDKAMMEGTEGHQKWHLEQVLKEEQDFSMQMRKYILGSINK